MPSSEQASEDGGRSHPKTDETAGTPPLADTMSEQAMAAKPLRGRFGRRAVGRRLYSLSQRAMFLIDPEKAHRAAIGVIKSGILARLRPSEASNPQFRVAAMGLEFPNPIGVAAGFDKNGEVIRQLLDMGFGFVEAGTVTPHPHGGNRQPRVFRLVEHAAIINRMGLNSEGYEAVRLRLETLRRDEDWVASTTRGRYGINVGTLSDGEAAVQDYVSGITTFSNLADYIAINVSCPNVTGGRDLQQGDMLRRLLGEVANARAGQNKPAPLVIKIAPDLEGGDLDLICEQVLAHDIAAITVANTTTTRPGLPADSALVREHGGLSGQPLRALAQHMLCEVKQRVGDAVTLIGVGGMDDTLAINERLNAGASLVQLYTGLVYRGPILLSDALTGLHNR